MKDRALSNQSSSKTPESAPVLGVQVSPAESVLPQVPHSTSKPPAKPAAKPAGAKPKSTAAATSAAHAKAESPQPDPAKADKTKAAKGANLSPAGPFVVRRKQSLLSNPLAASGLIGAGGLALTLAVGLTLTDDSSEQSQFSFRESPDSSLGDVDAQLAEMGNLAADTVEPSAATPEFSSASRVRPTQIPQISVSRTLRGPQRALAIENMLDQQTQELDRLTRLLASQPPAQQPAEGALAQAMNASAETAETAEPSADQSLPAVVAADPQAAIAALPVAPVVGTSAQAPVSAGVPTGAPQATETQRPGAIATVDLSEIQKLAVAPTGTTPEPMAIAVSGQFAPASEMAINRSMTLAQFAATVPADMLEEVYSMQAAQPGAVQPIVAVAPATPEGSVAPTVAAPAPAEAPSVADPAAEPSTPQATDTQGIRYFVSLEQQPNNPQQIWMLPLTNRAATEVASADKVEAFRVFRLPTQEYQRVWLAVRSVNPTQEEAAPLYGFIDYQRQIIVMPAATAATTPATPATPAS